MPLLLFLIVPVFCVRACYLLQRDKHSLVGKGKETESSVVGIVMDTNG